MIERSIKRLWDARFPGFGHDTHGVETRNDACYVQCVEFRP